MSYKELKRAVIAATGITRQGVEYRAKKVKREAGPMSTEQAIAVVAHDEDIDITQYLEPDEVQRVNQLVVQRAILESPEARARAAAPAQKTVKVSIAERFELSDPLLTERVLRDAREMAGVYAELYVFENSVREVIKRVLSGQYGAQWWEVCVKSQHPKVYEYAQSRMEDERRNAWHRRRGEHPIHYTDIPHLVTLIEGQWEHFKGLFPDQTWVTQRIKEIARSRNVVDHHNPLRKPDQERIGVYFDDWFRQVDSVRDRLA
jgi:hypothetical protein